MKHNGMYKLKTKKKNVYAIDNFIYLFVRTSY